MKISLTELLILKQVRNKHKETIKIMW